MALKNSWLCCVDISVY